MKKFIDVGAGVVDADYRGPVGVVLFNFGEEDFVVEQGDRVAQLVLEKISMLCPLEVNQLSLFEWEDPRRPYKDYDLTNDVKRLMEAEGMKMGAIGVFSKMIYDPPHYAT